MEKIIVPKDKCPMNVLAEMGEQTRNTWIFLHQSVIIKLSKSADSVTTLADYCEFVWNETEQYPKTILTFEKKVRTWRKVRRIYASDIAFRLETEDPDRILFLKMED